MLKHGILGLLNYRSMTGYEIMEVFRDSLKYFWTAQTSQIYRELNHLKAKDLISVQHIEQAGKPDKNLFSITEEGRTELIRWLRDDSVSSSVRSPLLMRTFFRGELSVEDNIAYFKQIMEHDQTLKDGSAIPSEKAAFYEQAMSSPEKALYWRMTIAFGQMYDEMLNNWCRLCIKELEGYKNEHSTDQRKPESGTE